jgi:hypothetical protein
MRGQKEKTPSTGDKQAVVEEKYTSKVEKDA